MFGESSRPRWCRLLGRFVASFTLLASTVYFGYHLGLSAGRTTDVGRTISLSAGRTTDVGRTKSSAKAITSPPAVVDLRISARDYRGADQGDPDLIEYLRRYKIQPPATGPYNLKKYVTDYSQWQQSTKLDKLLNHMTGGFYVEVGAHDGESLSNTLFFERHRNWTGLLIEADPNIYNQLSKKGRKAYHIHACLSLVPKCTEVYFSINSGYNGRINRRSQGAKVQCYPLFSLLQALGRNRIDLLSLDIEGDELKVLKTIPWGKMEIMILEVEVNHISEGEEAVRNYMESVGYTFLKKHNIDQVFVKQELYDEVLKRK